MDARMLYLHALTPLHCGTGQSTGVIDLPVARETVGNLPIVPASGIKGPLKHSAKALAGKDDAKLKAVYAAFGPETTNSDNAGSVVFMDGRLLCLSVGSYYGSFAYVTSPLALRRWRRDHEEHGLTPPPALHGTPAMGGIWVTTMSKINGGGVVFLSEYDFTVGQETVDDIAKTIASAVFPDQRDAEWRIIFEERFAVVNDDVFVMLSRLGMEVTARVRIKEGSKTVDEGALWYEENVPAESIFACPLLAAPRNGAVAISLFQTIQDATKRPVQIGGSATVGRGLTRIRIVEVQ